MMRKCACCKGPGPVLWSCVGRQYRCQKCHEDPTDGFFTGCHCPQCQEAREEPAAASTHRLLLEIPCGDTTCDACPWFDKAAAGACTLWTRAMTSGNRIPECLAAERAAGSKS